MDNAMECGCQLQSYTFTSFLAIVCKTVRPVLSDVLSILSVTLVCCGQTVGWIRMPLGTEVGLGPGHIVLNGNSHPSPRLQKEHTPANFRPMSVVAKWLDGSRCHLVRR